MSETETTCQDIIERLKQDGYCLLPNFLSDSVKIGFIREVDDILENSRDDNYKFGKAERIGSLKENSTKRPFIFEAFNSDILQATSKARFQGKPHFTEIFVTHEFINDRGIERNGYLHFDRLPTLKFFFYASEVNDMSDGPLILVPGSHTIGEELRKQESNNEYQNKKNRIKIDYPKLYTAIEDKMVPIFGAAGTLIIFHTDTFHMGGNVSSGHSRKICRLHMR